jgi:hypothetical protein
MSRQWNSLAELAAAIRTRADSGRRVILTPETARLVADAIERRPCRPDRLRFDPFSDGSTIYRLDGRGEIIEIVAFARNALATRAAFDYLCEREPEQSFVQRRRAWIEAERIVERPARRDAASAK